MPVDPVKKACAVLLSCDLKGSTHPVLKRSYKNVFLRLPQVRQQRDRHGQAAMTMLMASISAAPC